MLKRKSERSSAILALVDLGEPGTFASLLAALKRDQPSSFHKRVLGDLSRFSDPATFRKLEATEVGRTKGQSVAGFLEELSAAVDIPIVLSDEIAMDDQNRIASGTSKGKALAFLSKSGIGVHGTRHARPCPRRMSIEEPR